MLSHVKRANNYSFPNCQRARPPARFVITSNVKKCYRFRVKVPIDIIAHLAVPIKLGRGLQGPAGQLFLPVIGKGYEDLESPHSVVDESRRWSASPFSMSSYALPSSGFLSSVSYLSQVRPAPLVLLSSALLSSLTFILNPTIFSPDVALISCHGIPAPLGLVYFPTPRHHSSLLSSAILLEVGQ